MNSCVQDDGQLNDVDPFIWVCAASHLGNGYKVEEVDTSKVKVTQKGVTYEGHGDWFETHFLYEDVFTNESNLPTEWNYQELVAFTSRADWRIIDCIKSSILPGFQIVMEFPGRIEGHDPISACVQLPHNISGYCVDAHASKDDSFPIESRVNVNPFSTVEARVKLKTCRLRDAAFHTDVMFSGQVTVKGHKKRKPKHKVQVAVPVEALLQEAPGFTCTASSRDGLEGRAFYTIHGLCSGEVPVLVAPDLRDLQSLV